MWYAELSKDGLVKTHCRSGLSTASAEHPGDCCQDEPRENREPREQPLRIDVRPVHTDILPPINTEPPKPRRVYIRNSVELARYGYTPGCIGCEAPMTQRPSRDHTEQCRTRIIQAISSNVDLSARLREAHERMSCSVLDAEPNMKKVRSAEHTMVPFFHLWFSYHTHTLSAPVAHGGSSSSSAPSLPLLNTCVLMTVTSTLVQRS